MTSCTQPWVLCRASNQCGASLLALVTKAFPPPAYGQKLNVSQSSFYPATP